MSTDRDALAAARHDERDRCANFMEAMGEPGAAAAIRFIDWPPRDLTPTEIARGQEIWREHTALPTPSRDALAAAISPGFPWAPVTTIGAEYARDVALAAADRVIALAARPTPESGADGKDWPADPPRQRRGTNPFERYSDSDIAATLTTWAADQRQRETWRDGDTSTYRYRANLLEAAASRLAPAPPGCQCQCGGNIHGPEATGDGEPKPGEDETFECEPDDPAGVHVYDPTLEPTPPGEGRPATTDDGPTCRCYLPNDAVKHIYHLQEDLSAARGELAALTAATQPVEETR